MLQKLRSGPHELHPLLKQRPSLRGHYPLAPTGSHSVKGPVEILLGRWVRPRSSSGKAYAWPVMQAEETRTMPERLKVRLIFPGQRIQHPAEEKDALICCNPLRFQQG